MSKSHDVREKRYRRCAARVPQRAVRRQTGDTRAERTGIRITDLTARRIEAFVATLGDAPIWERFSG